MGVARWRARYPKLALDVIRLAHGLDADIDFGQYDFPPGEGPHKDLNHPIHPGPLDIKHPWIHMQGDSSTSSSASSKSRRRRTPLVCRLYSLFLPFYSLNFLFYYLFSHSLSLYLSLSIYPLFLISLIIYLFVIYLFLFLFLFQLFLSTLNLQLVFLPFNIK